MTPSLDDYCLAHSAPEPALLQALRRETHLRTLAPRMLAHWQQGLLLQVMARLAGATTVLEVGTFTGYSALCLAAALPPQGVLHTYDTDDEALDIALRFIAQSPQAAQIMAHHQSALEGAPLLGLTFDMVFIDGDKREYPDYYRMARQLTRAGDLIVADNVLWGGKVISPSAHNDRHTQSLQAFNDAVRSDSGVEQLMLPLRDGLTIVRVK